MNGVSICVTAYKADKYILETLDSIVSQTWFDNHTNYEILVGIDGCQDTYNLIKKKYSEYPSVRFFMMDSNKGTYVTTNTLMKISKYDYLVRFDSDDIMPKNFIKDIFENCGDADYVRVNYKNFGLNKRVHISNGFCFMKKSTFELLGGYMPWLCAADSEFYKRANLQVKCVDLPKIYYDRRAHSESLENSEETSMKSKIREEYHKYTNTQSEKNLHIECVTNSYKEIVDDYNNGVTVYVTAYKAKSFIKECLDSIQRQTWFKNHDNYEILVGVDNCQETLDYLKTIMNAYKHMHVYMMNENKGTYITSNTLINIAKYNNLIRFDSDDIMKPNMIDYVMRNKKDSDVYRFYLQNFGMNRTIYLSDGIAYVKKDFMMKYGGYQPWKCTSDSEFKKRSEKFGIHKQTNEILFLRRKHEESLTEKKGIYNNTTKNKGSYRKEKQDYIKKLVIHNEEDAIIKMVTNTYEEIFSDIKPNISFNDDEKIIVTLTTWKKRISYVTDVLDTILKNTMLPDKIVINLSSEEFARGEKDIPNNVLEYIKKHPIIEINWVSGRNTRQWKKTIPTMLKYQNDCIICVDDDKLYKTNFISTLVNEHKRFPNVPITTNSMYKVNNCLQHCGCGTLDKAEYYDYFAGIDFDELYDMASSDTFFTYLSHKTGHPIKYCNKIGLVKSGKEIEPLSKSDGTSDYKKHKEMFDFLVKKYGSFNDIRIKKNTDTDKNDSKMSKAEEKVRSYVDIQGSLKPIKIIKPKPSVDIGNKKTKKIKRINFI